MTDNAFVGEQAVLLSAGAGLGELFNILKHGKNSFPGLFYESQRLHTLKQSIQDDFIYPRRQSMFICTVRANTLKFFSVIALSLVILCTIILTVPEYTPASTKAILASTEQYNYEKVKTADDVRNFLAQFGWETETMPTEEIKIKIPLHSNSRCIRNACQW